jgi:hypothetical protein
LVTFTTEFGNAQAIWEGDKPSLDVEYFVEFEIPDTLNWNDSMKQIDEKACTLGMEKDTLYFIGCLESVDEDGYTVIRLGDSIISLIVEGDPFPERAFVKVLANKVVIYDMNY